MRQTHIDIVADIVCPWCYIGLRRLKAALESRPDINPGLHWRPYLLNPDIDEGGMEQNALYARAFGSESRVRRFEETVARAGKVVGIAFCFDLADFTPYSTHAHRLISAFDGTPMLLNVADALFTAYFAYGKDLGRNDVLIEVAGTLGITASEAGRILDEMPASDAFTLDDRETHRLGINGVPSFVIDGRYVISGAHDPVVLLRLLDVALGSADESSPMMSA